MGSGHAWASAILSEWASYAVILMNLIWQFFVSAVNGNHDWSVWNRERQRETWGFVNAETHTVTHVYCTQRSGLFRYQIPATPQKVCSALRKHLCVKGYYHFDIEEPCAVLHACLRKKKITHYLNIQIVRCTWEWFTKLAKSRRTFTDVLIFIKIPCEEIQAGSEQLLGKCSHWSHLYSNYLHPKHPILDEWKKDVCLMIVNLSWVFLLLL